MNLGFRRAIRAQSVAMSVGRRRRWIAVAIIGVLVVGAWLGRSWWLEPWLARKLARELTTALGGPVQVESLHGSWWHRATLTGLTGSDLTVGPLRQLRATAITAEYGPGVVTGNLAHVRRLTVSGAYAEIDLRRAPPENTAPSTAWAPFLASLPQPLPEIRLTGSFDLILNAGVIRCDTLAIIAGGDRIALAATGVQVPWLDTAQNFDLVLQVGDGGRLELAEPVTLPGLAEVEHLTLRADHEAQEFTLAAAIADGQGTVTVAPGTWSVAVEDIALQQIPTGLPIAVPPGLEGRVSARLDGGEGPLAFAVDLDAITYSPLHLTHGRLTGTWQDGAIEITTLDLDSGDGLTVTGTGLTATTTGQRSGFVQVAADDVRPLLRRLGYEEHVPVHPLAAQIRIAADGDGFRVDALTVNTVGLELIGAATWSGHRAGPWQVAGTIRADMAELGANLPTLDGLNGHVAGELTFSGQGTDVSTFALDVIGAVDDVVIGTLTIPKVDMVLRARERRLSASLLAGVSDTVVALEATAALAEDGAIAVTCPGLTVVRGDLVLSNTDTLRGQWDDGRWRLEPLHLTGPAGEIFASGTGDLEQIDAELRIAALDLTILRSAGLDVSVQGLLDVDAHVRGPLTQPDITLRSNVTDLQVGGVPGIFAVDLHQDAAGIHIDDVRIGIIDVIEADISGLWPVRLGRTGLTTTGTAGARAELTTTIASLDRLFGRWFSGGSLTCTATVVPDETGMPQLRAHLAVQQAQVVLSDPFAVLQARPEAPVIDAQIDLRANAARARADFSAQVEGRTILTGDAALLWQDGFSTAPLTGKVHLNDLDLANLSSISNQIVRLNGQLTGLITVDGTIANPQPLGRLHIRDGELKLRADVPTMAAVNGQIDLVDLTTVDIDVSAEMGYSPVHLVGRVAMEDSGPVIDLRLTADEALLIQNRDLRIRAATQDLRLYGPWRALRCEGTITITSGLWSRDIDLIGTGGTRAGVDDGRLELFSLDTPPLSELTFDLQIRTAVGNDQGLRLQNNLISADCQVDLHLGGTGRAPQPNGIIVTQDARVTLPFSILAVERAELHFPDGDPFRPTITLNGTSQVRQWRIAVQARGPIDDVVIEASVPGMTTEDAVLLMTTGGTRTELTEAEGQRAMLSRVGTYVGLELMRAIRGPGDPDAEDTLLDRWSLDIGREISRDGRETIDAEIRLNPYEKRHGWILYGQRDRFDEYNVGLTLRLQFGGSDQ